MDRIVIMDAEEVGADLAKVTGDLALFVLQQKVKRLTVDSNLGTVVDLANPFAPNAGGTSGKGDAAMRALQPRLKLEVEGLGTIKVNPYGDPGPNMLPVYKAGAVIAVLGFTAGLGWFVFGRRKRR